MKKTFKGGISALVAVLLTTFSLALAGCDDGNDNGGGTNPGVPVAIAAGSSHTIALGSDGKVRATGRNDIGQLGLGDTTDKNTFVIPKLSDFNIPQATLTPVVMVYRKGEEGETLACLFRLRG